MEYDSEGQDSFTCSSRTVRENLTGPLMEEPSSTQRSRWVEVYLTLVGSEESDRQRSDPGAQARGTIYTCPLGYMGQIGAQQAGWKKNPEGSQGREGLRFSCGLYWPCWIFSLSLPPPMPL